MYSRLFFIIVLIRFAMPPFALADEIVPPAQNPPEMEQEARDWLDSPGSQAFGKWLAKMLERQPDNPEWLAMFADIRTATARLNALNFRARRKISTALIGTPAGRSRHVRNR
jgi:hypothetical protein